MIIFDLDSLANDKHRRHLITPPKDVKFIFKDSIPHGNGFFLKGDYEYPSGEIWKPDYEAYYNSCDKDEPVKPVITLWNKYEVEIAIEHADLQIWTSRDEFVREKTVNWLNSNIYTARIEDYEEMLKMRPIGDVRPQEVLFEEWLDETCKESLQVDFVFSSHKPTIEMFRHRGVFVFDCNQGKN